MEITGARRSVFRRALALTNVVIFLLANATNASAADLLDRVRASAEREYANLVNFVCREQIDRFKGTAHSPNGHKLDTVLSTVAYVNNSEQYSAIYRNNRSISGIHALPGAWSQGEYGTVLRETIERLQSRPVRFVSFAYLDGVPAAVYAFEYKIEESPWAITVGGRRYRVPFRSQVWASPATGDVLRIDRIATDVPMQTGIAGINWVVSFDPVAVDNKPVWLPKKGIYSVLYLNSDRHEWNLIAFTGYQKFGSDVVIRFR